MEHWNSIDACPNCGEYLVGDGYSNGDPVRCPNALEEKWWYSEPDSGPWYCEETDYYESENPLERPY